MYGTYFWCVGNCMGHIFDAEIPHYDKKTIKMTRNLAKRYEKDRNRPSAVLAEPPSNGRSAPLSGGSAAERALGGATRLGSRILADQHL